MKRELWNQCLQINYSPPWPCPTCAKGFLALVPESLTYKETSNSKRDHSDTDWDPEWIRYVFTAWLKCNIEHCGEDVVVSGTGEESSGYPEEDTAWSPKFTPKFCLPMPDIFEIPRKCPKKVKDELRKAFAVFWSDHAASSAHIRISMERLMDHLKIAATKKEKNKTKKLDLHKRIEIFQKTDAIIGSQLMALKWLGNTSAHEGEVSREDVLDAFEILEHSLYELIERRSEKVANMAGNLTHKHDPKTKLLFDNEPPIF